MRIKKILESFTSGFRSSFQNDHINKDKNISLVSEFDPKTLSTNETANISSIKKYTFDEIKNLSNFELRLITPDNLVDNLNNLEKKQIAEYISLKLKSRIEISLENAPAKKEENFPFIRPLVQSKKPTKSSAKNATAPIITTQDTTSKAEENSSLSSANGANLNYYDNKANKSKALSAFVSYASSPESLQVFLNKQKVTVFINGLSHDDEKSSDALLCKQFLDNNLKKKTVYLEKLQDLNESTILANVFFDKNKTINMATVAEKHGFHTSKSEPLSENDLVIPDKKIIPKYNNKKDINLADYSDIKFQEEKELTAFESCFNKYKHILDKENQIGLLLEHGEAPYLFEKNNSKSYFVKIKQIDKDIFLWGQNLPKALSDSNTIPGDFIHLNKYVEENPKTKRKYNLWSITNIEKGLDASLQEKFFIEHPEYNQSSHVNHDNHSDSSNGIDDVNLKLREMLNNQKDFAPDSKEPHTEVSDLDSLFDQDNPFLQLDINTKKNKPHN